MSKIIGVVSAEAASPDSVMAVLKDALVYARKHSMNAAFIVMVPVDKADVSFMKAATQVTPEAIDTLLELVEEGHEVVYQLNSTTK